MSLKSAPQADSFYYFNYITLYHELQKRVLTKLIARTRFSDSDYLFSEINVNL